MLTGQRLRRFEGIENAVLWQAIREDFPIVLIFAHHKTEREKQAGKQQDEHEQANDMATFENAVPDTCLLPAYGHTYFCEPPRALVH